MAASACHNIALAVSVRRRHAQDIDSGNCSSIYHLTPMSETHIHRHPSCAHTYMRVCCNTGARHFVSVPSRQHSARDTCITSTSDTHIQSSHMYTDCACQPEPTVKTNVPNVLSTIFAADCPELRQADRLRRGTSVTPVQHAQPSTTMIP